jgi:hypothetical protein
MAVTHTTDRPPGSGPQGGPGACARTWPWWVAIAAALVGVALLETGGIDVRVPLLRISAHNPRPLIYVAALVTMAALTWRRSLAWTLVAAIEGTGRTAWILVEAWEQPAFAARHGRSRLGTLDWPPAAEIRSEVQVRVHRVADRAVFHAGSAVATDHVAARTF